MPAGMVHEECSRRREVAEVARPMTPSSTTKHQTTARNRYLLILKISFSLFQDLERPRSRPPYHFHCFYFHLAFSLFLFPSSNRRHFSLAKKNPHQKHASDSRPQPHPSKRPASNQSVPAPTRWATAQAYRASRSQTRHQNQKSHCYFRLPRARLHSTSTTV